MLSHLSSSALRCRPSCTANTQSWRVKCASSSCAGCPNVCLGAAVAAGSGATQPNASVLLLIMTGGNSASTLFQYASRATVKDTARASPAALACGHSRVACLVYLDSDSDTRRLDAPTPGLTIVRPKEYLSIASVQVHALLVHTAARAPTALVTT